jgi:hypothetical protein
MCSSDQKEPRLIQPIFASGPEPGHDRDQVLTISQFINLLRKEEEYFEGEQKNTKLMITRLRKIFYDRWGWNTELIRGAAHIPGRYRVDIVENPALVGLPPKSAKKLRRYKAGAPVEKYRLVRYRKDDREFGNTRSNHIPFIYQNDHQETLLPDGTYCDVAHVLAGLDAGNHLQVVSPLPPLFSFLNGLFPHVDSNMDIVTWLGDIASSSADFLFACLRKGLRSLGAAAEQGLILKDAPGSDMLGDIDAYVIRYGYPVSEENALRVTDILTDYYIDGNTGGGLRKKRIRIFCDAVGLIGWDGNSFSNELQWMDYYERQLRNNTSFQAWSLNENGPGSLWIPLRIWLGGYKRILVTRCLLKIFLIALKRELNHESNFGIAQ